VYKETNLNQGKKHTKGVERTVLRDHIGLGIVSDIPPSTKISPNRLGVVTHACIPSYLGGIDPEDHSSRPAWAKSS
jgi:hypothetical protein